MRIPGKINLFLKVGGVRLSDGRHELSTLFLPLEKLCDDVCVTPSAPGGGMSLRCEGRAIPDVVPQENIVWRAASAFCDAFDVKPDWELFVRKEIPVSGGLGGGSADAAAVLLELRRQCGKPIPSAELAELALRLGADVPFFLDARPSYATGAGEKLTPVEVHAHCGVVVVYPGIPSPVAWAYRHCRTTIPLSGMPSKTNLDDIDGLAELVDNDLAPALLLKAPVYNMAIDALRKCGCVAATVSGSGSSCFGICPPGMAREICGRLREEFKDMPSMEVFWASER